MTLRLITAPASEPASLDELKSFASIQHNEDDDLLGVLLTAAREFAEATIGGAIPTQTWEITAREWPDTVFVLPKPPLQSVVSVKHRDAAGAVVTLSPSTDYIVDLAGGAIEPVTAWPHVGDYPDAVQVRLTAGYEETPQRAKLTIMSLAAFWYDVRLPNASSADGMTRRVPFHVKAMLAQLRGGRLETAN